MNKQPWFNADTLKELGIDEEIVATVNKPAQPPYNNEVKKLRDDAEQEILNTLPIIPDQVVFRTMRDGTILRFRRFGKSFLIGYHIYYPEEEQTS